MAGKSSEASARKLAENQDGATASRRALQPLVNAGRSREPAMLPDCQLESNCVVKGEIGGAPASIA